MSPFVVCADGDLRLVGGVMTGRLEVCSSNIWGTVCDDGFSVVDASVACGQLGFSPNSMRHVYTSPHTHHVTCPVSYVMYV